MPGGWGEVADTLLTSANHRRGAMLGSSVTQLQLRAMQFLT